MISSSKKAHRNRLIEIILTFKRFAGHSQKHVAKFFLCTIANIRTQYNVYNFFQIYFNAFTIDYETVLQITDYTFNNLATLNIAYVVECTHE